MRPPYQPGDGIHPLESEYRLPHKTESRIEFMLRVEKAIRGGNITEMEQLLLECEADGNRQASARKLRDALSQKLTSAGLRGLERKGKRR